MLELCHGEISRIVKIHDPIAVEDMYSVGILNFARDTGLNVELLVQ
jgi:hypothetical protein